MASWCSSKAQNLSEILGFISRSEQGAALVAQVQERICAGGLEIIHATQIELDRLRGPRAHGHASAAFVMDANESRSKDGRILYLAGLEVGVSAALLAHECVHATDELFIRSHVEESRLWAALEAASTLYLREASSRLGRSISSLGAEDLREEHLDQMHRLKCEWQRFADQRLFRAERRAYDWMEAWVCDMDQRQPGFRAYLAQKRSDGYVLDRVITDQELVRVYGLDSLSSAA